jgi:hypothetical protein
MESSLVFLPSVGRIEGAVLHRDGSEHNCRIQVQYRDHNGTLYEVWIPFLDAMYLRNILDSVESDAGFGDFRKQRT